MAEGLLKALYGDYYEAYSAGTEPTKVNPYAIKAMAEIGIDILLNRAKSVNEFIELSFDYVVTVCDNAKEACPFFPGGKTQLHKSFEDPAGFNGTEEEILFSFKRIREEIKSWITETFGSISDPI
jgi:arsenate reductase